MTNIEQLKNEVKDITNSLKELKEDVSLPENEKKRKAEELKSQAETAKQKIEDEIKTLENSTDSESNKKIEEAKTVLNSLTEVMNLYNSIIQSLNTSRSTPVQPEMEEKNIFTKAKDWIWDQWDSIWTKEKRTIGSEWWKNVLRTAWFIATWVWAVALTYKWLKTLRKRAFSDDKEEDTDESGSKSKKKKKKKSKPFWDRWYWRALKRGAIGTWIYWVAHWIFTWSWFEDLLKRWSLKTEKPKEQVNKYKELSPEMKEKYESLWEKVNEFYDNIRSKEVSNGYNNPYDLWTISKNVANDTWNSNADVVYKWLVPFCMDDGLKNVEQLLSERNFTTYLFDKDTTEVMTEITSWTSGAIWSVLWKFVWSLESFIPFSSGSGSLSEKIQKWFESDPQSRIDELNFFFRQYTKVLTYMKDKERAIAYKIAEEKCQSELSEKSEDDKVKFIQEKLADNDRFENNVKKDSRYQNFMNSKILNSGEALTNAGLFDWEMSPILNGWIIDPLDNEFDNIMQIDEDGKTIVDKWIEEFDGNNLGNQTKIDLVKMCNDLKDDIEDNNDRWWLFAWLSYLFNSNDSNREKFLEETWLKDFMNNLTWKIDGIKTKIENGTVTKAELEQLKETTLAYFAFQKEMEVAIYTIQWIRSDNPDYLRRLIESQVIWFNNFMSRLNKIFSWNGEFWDFLVVGVWAGQITLVLSSSARRAAWRTARKGFKRTIKQPKNAIVWVAWRPTFSNKWFREALQWLGDATHKQSYFLHYALNWKIRNERFLLEVAKNDLRLTNTNSIGEVLFDLLKWSSNPWLTREDCELLWKYAWNSDIKKLIIDETIPWGRINEMLTDWFKPWSRQFKLNRANFDELKKVDTLFNEDYIKNSSKAKKLLERMLSKSVHNVDDLKYLQELFIDDEFFKVINEIEDTPKAIRHMAKHLREVKNSTAFSTMTNEIQKIMTSWVNLPQKITALEDYRRWLAVMDSKEFKLTNSCIKFLWEWDFIDNMKIIKNLMEEWIQGGTGWWKYKVKFDDLTDEVKIQGIIDRLNSSSPRWRETVFWSWSTWTTKFNKFMSSLDNFKAGKVFSSVDDATTVLTKAIKLVAKLS